MVRDVDFLSSAGGFLYFLHRTFAKFLYTSTIFQAEKALRSHGDYGKIGAITVQKGAISWKKWL